jgi:CheY-like chemotaxis protein
MSRDAPPTVLVIDDDFQVRRSARSIAEKAGYIVKDAASADEAFLLLALDGIALVITDLGLPDINGLEIARTIQLRWPHIAVVLMSDGILPTDTPIGTRFLMKPLSPGDYAGYWPKLSEPGQSQRLRSLPRLSTPTLRHSTKRVRWRGPRRYSRMSLLGQPYFQPATDSCDRCDRSHHMTGPITLGDLAGCCDHLRIVCTHCGHAREWQLSALSLPADTPLPKVGWGMRCTACGSRKMKARPPMYVAASQ